MGAPALSSHANGTRHKQKVSAANPLALFFKANEQTAPEATPSFHPVQHQIAMAQSQKRTTMHLHLPSLKSNLLMMQVMPMMLKFDGA